MNITQQVSASVGTALFSVLLTSAYNQHGSVGFTLAVQNAAGDHDKIAAILQQFHIPADRLQALYNTGLHYMGESFGRVFLVAAILVALCFVPAFFLSRKPPVQHVHPGAME
jgi:hypothetical protein